MTNRMLIEDVEDGNRKIISMHENAMAMAAMAVSLPMAEKLPTPPPVQ